jgi:hypothetical protein
MIYKLVLGLGIATGAATALVLACSSGGTGFGQGADSGGSGVDGSSGSDDAGLGPGPCPNLDFPATCPVPPPSWKNDVQPLVIKYCVQCHGPGASAANQLLLGNYTEVAANRTKCWYQIDKCWMPNQDGSPPPLAYPTPAERQTMVNWMDVCNAPDN